MRTLNRALSITISLLLLSLMVYAQTSVNHNSGRSNKQEIQPSPMMKLNKMQKLPSLLMSQPDIEKAEKIL